MQKTYSRINWEDYPSENTAIDAENLNAMDSAVDTIDDRVITLDSGKLNITDAASLVKSITYDSTNGTFTITFYNGSTATIDTDIEKIAVNFDYDSTNQKLIITLEDGTKKEVDLSALITQYEFTNTSTIGFSVATDGKVSANVLDNSITDAKMESKYLTNVQNYASNASASADTSEAKSLVAEGWAVGQQNGEDVGSSSPYYHNNAKYYSDKAGVTSLSSLSDVSISSTANGDLLAYDSSSSKWLNKALDLSNYIQKKTVTGTLTAGETSITLSDSRITTDSIIDCYFKAADGTETEPICYNTITVASGSVTMTFDALDADLDVLILII